MKIREVLNKLLWDSRLKKEDFEVVFTHRGAYQDRRVIPFKTIKRVDRFGFIYLDERGKETIIPFHRVLEVRNMKTGEPIWRKKGLSDI